MVVTSPLAVTVYAGFYVVYVYVRVFEKLLTYFAPVEGVEAFDFAFGVCVSVVVGYFSGVCPATVFTLPSCQFFSAPAFVFLRLELACHWRFSSSPMRSDISVN